MSEPATDPAAEPAAEPAQTHDLAVGPAPEPIPHAGLRYSLLRLVVLLVVGGVLYLLGFRSWLLLLLAFAISGLVSYFVLMRTRDAAAANLERRVQVWNVRRRAAEEAEEAQFLAQARAAEEPAPDAPADSAATGEPGTEQAARHSEP